MIKKITLPLLVAGTILGVSSTASADLLYAGIGMGVSVTSQDQGTMKVPTFDAWADEQTINVVSKAGSMSGSAFVGISPIPFISIEGDFEYTSVANKIKQDVEWKQGVFGDKPVETSIITPFLNVVLHTPTFGGVGLFALAGVGASRMSTTTKEDNPDYDYDLDFDDSGIDDDGNNEYLTKTNAHWSRAFDFGGGVFYEVPATVNLVTLSAGFRYINLGGAYTKAAFDLKATSKEEVFLRAQIGF